MGYYSDCYLAVSNKGGEFFKQIIENETYLVENVEESKGDDIISFRCFGIKGGLVDKLEYYIDCLNQQGYSYCYVRVGEDYNDIDIDMSSSEDDELVVYPNIEVNVSFDV